MSVISDAKAAVAALHDDPGLPTSGIVAVCDFGGSGTSITLFDAANGGEPIGQTVRHTELSGDLIDQAVLTQVLGGISDAGAVDLTGTSAIGPLTRLRTQCRAAKERLSTTAATSLAAELPGHRGEVRLTRNELDEADPAAARRLRGRPSGDARSQRGAWAGRRRIHGWWRARSAHHDDAVRALRCAGHHHPAARTDAGDRRRPPGRPRHRGRGRDSARRKRSLRPQPQPRR